MIILLFGTATHQQFYGIKFRTPILNAVVLVWLAFGAAWEAANVTFGTFISVFSTFGIVAGVSIMYTSDFYESKTLAPKIRNIGGIVSTVFALILPNIHNSPLKITVIGAATRLTLMCTLFFIIEYSSVVCQLRETVRNKGQHKTSCLPGSLLLVRDFDQAIRIGWPLFVHPIAMVLVILQALPHFAELNVVASRLIQPENDLSTETKNQTHLRRRKVKIVNNDHLLPILESVKEENPLQELRARASSNDIIQPQVSNSSTQFAVVTLDHLHINGQT